MRYDERIVDQVQAATDIVEFIQQYVPLKRMGRNFKGLCPFHSEKTPSFMVHPEKQIFHCFGCSAGGDVFTFLMRHENMNFPEAVRQLAERASIRLPEKTEFTKEGPSESEKLYEAYRLAADFYHAQFWDAAKGRPARDYFKRRGFDEATAKEFQIGWAVDAWQGLFEFLSKKGFAENLLLRSGLIHRSPKGNCYDSFRGRLLFPIRNLQGKVMAFGGRLLGEGEGPKYLNSAENPIFQKGKELFGLHAAKKFIKPERRQLLVVEGYFDFLRLYVAGFKSTVATLGTALTDTHVQVLKRFCEEAVVIYDGDKAGEAASLRGLEVFLEGGMNVKLVRLPEGFDPDDFIEKKGNEAFEKLIAEARDFFDYKLEVMLTRFDPRDSLGLVQITNEFLETLQKVKNSVLLDRYVRKLAGAVGISEYSLRDELAKFQKKIQTREGQKALPPLPVNRQGARQKTRADFQEEVLVLVLMSEGPAIRAAALDELGASDFRHPALREIFSWLRENEASVGRVMPVSKLVSRLEDDALKQKMAEAASIDWTSEQRQEAFGDCLKKIKRMRLERRLEELRRQIALAESQGDGQLVGKYAKEYQTLLKQTT